MSESLVKSVIISTRPSFLVLTSICLLLGVAAAGHGSRVTGSDTDSEFVITAVLILISALAAYVSVNTFAIVGCKHYPISWMTPLVLALTVLFA